MSRRILVIFGHPARTSLCAGLGRAYADAARAAGHEVRELRVRELSFDPVLHEGYRTMQALEPDLVRSQQDILWSEHLVLAYPSWWGMPPALLKGFIDRAILPGFGFKHRDGSRRWDKLLIGRSARLLVTMDAPGWWDACFYGGARLMKNAVLGYCGVSPVRISRFSSVKHRAPSVRAGWVGVVEALGRRAS